MRQIAEAEAFKHACLSDSTLFGLIATPAIPPLSSPFYPIELCINFLEKISFLQLRVSPTFLPGGQFPFFCPSATLTCFMLLLLQYSAAGM